MHKGREGHTTQETRPDKMTGYKDGHQHQFRDEHRDHDHHCDNSKKVIITRKTMEEWLTQMSHTPITNAVMIANGRTFMISATEDQF